MEIRQGEDGEGARRRERRLKKERTKERKDAKKKTKEGR